MSGSPSDACDLTLDPNTAHRRLSLSEDNRKVTLVGEDQSYPDHPDRFDSWPQVLGREALTGRCYWEVEWGGREPRPERPTPPPSGPPPAASPAPQRQATRPEGPRPSRGARTPAYTAARRGTGDLQVPRAEMALSAAVFTVELLREQARAQRPLLFRLWGQKFRAPKLFSLADL
ncbi:unnamed protein product [Arctogadus glacialis]